MIRDEFAIVQKSRADYDRIASGVQVDRERSGLYHFSCHLPVTTSIASFRLPLFDYDSLRRIGRLRPMGQQLRFEPVDQ
jgi:hypothetical protein